MSWSQGAILFLATTTGAFFFLTGFRKVFVPETHAQVWDLFSTLGVPVPARWLVIYGELGLGFLLLISMNPIVMKGSAVGLLIIMSGAVILDIYPGIMRTQPRPLSYTRCVSSVLCTPETQLIFILVAILIGA